jgi:hypothetical protein
MQSELFQTNASRAPRKKLAPLMIGGKSFDITPVFHAYWRFASERHTIFRRRLKDIWPVTDDPVLAKFKFTNAYRVLDRTSQYLVGEVIQKGDQSPSELYFRILIFKLFNKIETWELLRRHFGDTLLRVPVRVLRPRSHRGFGTQPSDLLGGIHHALGRPERRKQETPFSPQTA